MGILLGAAILLVALAVGIAALSGEEPAGPADEPTRTVTPAEQTTEAVVPVPSYGETAVPGADPAGESETGSSTGGSSGASQGASGQATGAQQGARSNRIAYRRDGWLCMAAPDGTAEQRVAASTSGVFSLSPDGGTIASVDADGQLRLYEVADGRAVTVGPAERDRPAWAPDSAWLVFTAPGQRVTRVDRDGAGSRTLFSGRLPVVASDSRTVIAAASTVLEPAVVLWRAGETERLAVESQITGLACSGSRIYTGSAPGAGGVSTLCSMSFDGSGRRTEVRSQSSARSVSVGGPAVSPDGVWVAYVEQGDDGYSRVYVLPTAGGATMQVSGRRDTYLLQWMSTSDALVLAEGNPTQGEPLAIVSATVPGRARRLLVEAAGG